MNYSNLFSERINSVPKSFIREILSLIQNDDIISFAGGLPNPEFFPVEEFRQASNKVLMDCNTDALQYTITEGYKPLRAHISKRYKQKFNLDVPLEQILITSGSQQGIDLLAKVLMNKGDGLLIENPTYLAAIQSFIVYQPEFFSVSLQNDGPDLAEMEQILENHDIKAFYSIPNFQNPTGLTYSDEKRRRIAGLLKKHNTLLLVDDPYGDIRFEGTPAESFKNLYEHTILMGSFSKTVSPGCRLGWLVAPKEIYEKLYIAKQASDLHTSYLTQRIMAQFLDDHNLDQHVSKISDFYGKQKDAMIRAIKEYLPDFVEYTKPEGGMFIWLTIREDMDALKLFKAAVEEGVAFVPGEPFFVNRKKKNTMRMNFTNVSEDVMMEGMKRLARAFEKVGYSK